jgi:hypothetical protein
MIQRSLKTLAVVVALAFLAIGAQAALINVGDSLAVSDASGDSTQCLANGLYEVGTVTYYSSPGVAAYGTPINCYAGAFELTIHNITQSTTFNLETFCTDVGVDWNNGPNVAYTAKTFAGSDGVAPSWSTMPQAIQNAAWIYKNFFLNATFTPGQQSSEDAAAGVQLAIWKALYDTSSGGLLSSTTFTTGKLQASGFSGISDAQTYLTDLNNARNGGTFTSYSETWLDPVNGNSQGLIYSPTVVPEPTTLIAGALLLLPFGASTLRFMRKHGTV